MKTTYIISNFGFEKFQSRAHLSRLTSVLSI